MKPCRPGRRPDERDHAVPRRGPPQGRCECGAAFAALGASESLARAPRRKDACAFASPAGGLPSRRNCYRSLARADSRSSCPSCGRVALIATHCWAAGVDGELRTGLAAGGVLRRCRRGVHHHDRDQLEPPRDHVLVASLSINLMAAISYAPRPSSTSRRASTRSGGPSGPAERDVAPRCPPRA